MDDTFYHDHSEVTTEQHEDCAVQLIESVGLKGSSQGTRPSFPPGATIPVSSRLYGRDATDMRARLCPEAQSVHHLLTEAEWASPAPQPPESEQLHISSIVDLTAHHFPNPFFPGCWKGTFHLFLNLASTPWL